MAKGIYIQKGEIIDYVNNGSADIAYGEVVPLVSRIGVAAENIPVGAIGGVRTEGVFELPAVNDTEFNVGDQLYWDTAAGKLTKNSSGTIPAGWCVEAKATNGDVAKVKIG
ncbi:MAG: DUF2190 family protein [Caldicoprobacter oshimai]